jgi:hypothetical protein
MNSRIKPVTIFPDVAVSLEIMSAQINNFGVEGSANLIWTLNSENGVALKHGIITLAGADYQLWNNDEPYLINYVSAQLGLELIND